MTAAAFAAFARQCASRLAAALADPDAQPLRARTFGWLAWSMLISVALHAAILSVLQTLPLRMEPGPLRFALHARLAATAAASPEPSAARTQPAADRAERTQARSAPEAGAPAQSGDAAPGARLPPRYYSSREVDTPAVALEPPALVYPEEPWIWKLPGRVRLRVFIGSDGRVEGVEIVSAQPPGHFEQAALDAAHRLRYAPALLGGEPVRSQKLIEVEFDPHEHLRPRAGAGHDARIGGSQ